MQNAKATAWGAGVTRVRGLTITSTPANATSGYAEGETIQVNTTTAVEFRQRRVEIEEREPPKLRVIDLLCHNELGTSTYRYKKPTRLNGSDDPSGASSTSRWRTSLNNRQTCRNSSDARPATDGRDRARHAIRALQRLARRRTLGVGEQRVEFLLEHLEAKLARRLMVFQQFPDAVRKLFEHSPDIDTGGFVLRAMGY